MQFTVVFNFLITLNFNDFTILERKLVGGVFQVLFFYQDTLESLGIEPKGRTTFKSPLVGVEIDVLEFFKWVVRWHIGSF